MPDDKKNWNTGSSVPDNGTSKNSDDIDFGEPDILKHSWDHTDPDAEYSGYEIPESHDVYKGSDD